MAGISTGPYPNIRGKIDIAIQVTSLSRVDRLLQVITVSLEAKLVAWQRLLAVSMTIVLASVFVDMVGFFTARSSVAAPKQSPPSIVSQPLSEMAADRFTRIVRTGDRVFEALEFGPAGVSDVGGGCAARARALWRGGLSLGSSGILARPTDQKAIAGGDRTRSHGMLFVRRPALGSAAFSSAVDIFRS